MTLNLTIPQTQHTDFTPRITVIGVGGGGTNAVDNMIQLNLQGVDFVVANTDAQQLMNSKSDRRIQLGPHLTQGLGAGAKPEIGRAAAEEAADVLARHLDGVHMVFITAGMGGGTGTGAAPVIARMARERGILTVGVVTKPFTFEGVRRARSADQGIAELQQFVDTLIVIPNQNLFRIANEKTGWREAFKMADHVLYMGVRGVTDLMVAPGLVNLDFADIRTVMAEMGKAMMGTGEADGENRAIRAAEAAINNPLLEDTSMAGARGLLINITGGDDLTLFEVDQAANRIREEVAEDANIIFGSAVDESLNGRIRVSVVATGIDSPMEQAAEPPATGPRLVAVGGAAPTPARFERPGQPGGHAAPHLTGTGGMPAHLMGNTATGRVPMGNQATALAMETIAEEEPIQLTAAQVVPPAPSMAHTLGRGVSQPHPLFTPAGAEPAAPARPSLFGKVTGAWRRGATPPPAAPELPDMRRAEPRFAPEQPEPAASDSEAVGLDIPAFLRRQTS
jgi:cell division protein FtsZ